MAQRVLRDVRLGAVPGRGHRIHAGLDHVRQRRRSPGPTGRTSCRRRTRSPPTSPTCTPSRSTSTASPTPRAPACSSSWSPTSGWSRSCPGCATTSATTRSATPPSAICLARWRSRRAAICPTGARQWLKTTGLNTLRADFDVDADGQVHPVRDRAGRRRARRRRDPGAPAGGRHLRRRRHRASWCGCTARNSTSTGPATDVPALVRCFTRQADPGQRRRPDLLLAAAGPESLQTVLTRIADIADPLPRTLVWSAAWEMTREAETEGPRLRRAGA